MFRNRPSPLYEAVSDKLYSNLWGMSITMGIPLYLNRSSKFFIDVYTLSLLPIFNNNKSNSNFN